MAHRMCRSLLTAFAAVAAFSGATLARPAEAQAEDRVPTWGGWGYAFFGPLFGDYRSIEDELRRDDALGPELSIPSTSWAIGGGGHFLMAGRILLSGKGYGAFSNETNTPRGSATLTGGGGGFDVGVAVLNQDNWILYPSVGVGGFGYTLNVENGLATVDNTGNDDVVIGDRTRLRPGNEVDLQGGFWTFEAAIGVTRLLFDAPTKKDKSGNGGFNVGLQTGLLVSFAPSDWTIGDGVAVDGLESPGLTGGFIRLCLGGGGFTYE